METSTEAISLDNDETRDPSSHQAQYGYPADSSSVQLSVYMEVHSTVLYIGYGVCEHTLYRHTVLYCTAAKSDHLCAHCLPTGCVIKITCPAKNCKGIDKSDPRAD